MGRIIEHGEVQQIQHDQPRNQLVKQGDTIMSLISMAVEKDASIEKLQQLMDLQERWESNQARKSFAAAISAARAQIKPIVKTAKVDYVSKDKATRTTYMHETMDAIADQIDPILSEHGLSYRYKSRQEQGMLHVTCIIEHRDGHFEETTLAGPPDTSGSKNAYQSVGSAATYLQRYTLKLALGLSAAKDDDASGAEATEQQGNWSQNPGGISSWQAEQLRKAIIVAGLTEQEFCSNPKLKISRIEDLPAQRFGGAMRGLEAKAKGERL